MKDIISIQLNAQKADLTKAQSDLLVVSQFSDSKGLEKYLAALDVAMNGAISQLTTLGDFKGKEATSAILYGNANIGAKRVMVVGLGERKKANLDTLRKAAAYAANKAVNMKVENVAIAVHPAFLSRQGAADAARAMTEGVYFGAYRYDEFVTDSENGRPEKLNVSLLDTDAANVKKIAEGISKGAIVGNAQNYARTLSNRPANVLNPAELASQAKKIAATHKNLDCTIFDEKQLAELGMGGIMAIGSGSASKPRLIVLKYSSSAKSAGKLPTVAPVGKAITFDSGGISLKPSANMEQMKLDKSGGIAVLATMKAAAELELPINLYGLVPAAENMPSGSSCRPGDIVTTFSGKTVEIQNTDAEGRMILCDALTYAVKENCDIIVDVATLTGACMVALGKYMAGLFGNDDKLIKQIQIAAEDSGEKVWPMPSGEEYAKEMKSKIADLKNIGSKWGGACNAAAFLSQFVGEKRWAHLDIAGVDLFEKSTELSSEGSTGYGVRLLTAFLINFVRSKK